MTQIKVTYIDHCGSDLTTVNAARVSFGKKSEWEYHDSQTMRLAERDTKLINYLAKHKHISPFGHAFASFHCKAPLFVHAQLVKHKFLRTNTISRRYTTENIEFYEPDVWRGRSADKKQGSEGVVEDYNTTALPLWHDDALKYYNMLLKSGVAPEQARMVLPQSTMTEWYWSGSLDAFASMCQLRCKEDTQYESRIVANQISEVMGKLYPVSWAALMGET
jgi:thymidylate synthase (FAD)